ncbi:hypothetical protein K435DRAFT_870892 [Dendrothele bispora CBS 962.96]|uniref:Uncharacterized protein n=1 Tax=Dendrothele bispora (strain CBS 962.96) TaxID=1314807 RepID=A0A4S8L5F5_DENBC|nr:hypothetical protein K435DRAFT_870892 [Dendrothele bispora CBS 962.96]
MAAPAPIHAVEPTGIVKRAQDASPTVTLCTGPGFTSICVMPAVVSDECVNLTGGLTTLNKELSSAVIPGGFICTFFTNFGCTTASAQDSRDELGLSGGSYPHFSEVVGIAGTVNFEDVPSSYSCSPV